jgi:hypothetical protein
LRRRESDPPGPAERPEALAKRENIPEAKSYEEGKSEAEANEEAKSVT